MKKLSLLLLAGLTIACMACGDDDDGGGSGSCEKAEAVLNDCDGLDNVDFKSCSGAAAEFAQCVVDHPDAACGDPEASDAEDYTKCAQAALGQ